MPQLPGYIEDGNEYEIPKAPEPRNLGDELAGFGGAVRSAIELGAAPLADRFALGGQDVPDLPRLTPAEIAERQKAAGVTFAVPPQGMTEFEVNYWTEKARTVQDAEERAAKASGATQIAGGILGSIVDPTILMPVPGLSNAANRLILKTGAIASKTGRVAARTAIRSAEGAVEGAVGAAVMAPVVAEGQERLGREYGLEEFAADMGLSAAGGAALRGFIVNPIQEVRWRRQGKSVYAEIARESGVRAPGEEPAPPIPPEAPRTGAQAVADARAADVPGVDRGDVRAVLNEAPDDFRTAWADGLAPEERARFLDAEGRLTDSGVVALRDSAAMRVLGEQNLSRLVNLGDDASDALVEGAAMAAGRIDAAPVARQTVEAIADVLARSREEGIPVSRLPDVDERLRAMASEVQRLGDAPQSIAAVLGRFGDLARGMETSDDAGEAFLDAIASAWNDASAGAKLERIGDEGTDAVVQATLEGMSTDRAISVDAQVSAAAGVGDAASARAEVVNNASPQNRPFQASNEKIETMADEYQRKAVKEPETPDEARRQAEDEVKRAEDDLTALEAEIERLRETQGRASRGPNVLPDDKVPTGSEVVAAVRATLGDEGARWIEDGRAAVLTMDQLREIMPDAFPDAAGVELRMSDGSRRIVLVAEQLRGRDPGRVLLHEIFHFQREAILGDAGWAELRAQVAQNVRAVLDAQSAGKGLSPDLEAWRRAREAVPSETGEGMTAAQRADLIDEETVAYLVEFSPQSKFVQSIVAKVRAWLFQQGFRIQLTEADIRALAVSMMRRPVEMRGRAGARYSVESKRFSEGNRLSNLRFEGASWAAIKRENAALRNIKSMDDKVTIFRATIGDTIRPDDFVAVSRKTLESELENIIERDGPGVRILSQEVRVRDLLMGNDATEFVYFPEPSARYSKVGQGAPEDQKLIVMHSTSPDKLRGALDLGGLPAPSLGITKGDAPYSDFGGVSFIGRAGLVDPKKTPVFDSDIYSTRAPRVMRDPVRGVAPKFEAEFREGSKAYDDRLDLNLSQAVENGDLDRAKYHLESSPVSQADFLRSVGVDVAPVTKVREGEGLVGDPAVVEAAKAMRETLNGNVAPDQDFAPLEAAVRSYIEAQPERKRKILEESLLEDGGAIDRNRLSRIANDSRAVGVVEVDRGATREKLAAAIEPRKAEFKAWIDDLLAPAFKEPYIESGRRKLPVTLENIVAVMKKESLVGSEKTMTYGPGRVRAEAARRYRSIEEIKADRQKVVGPAEHEAAKKTGDEFLTQYRTKMAETYEIKNWRGQVDYFGAMDASMKLLSDIEKSRGTEADIRAAFKRNDFADPSPELIQEAKDALETILSNPVQYLEAKPLRAVGFEEFAGAVVPSDLDADLRTRLEEKGVRLAEYNPDVPGDRERVVAQFSRELDAGTGQVRFSRAVTPRTLREGLRTATDRMERAEKLWPSALEALGEFEPRAFDAEDDYAAGLERMAIDRLMMSDKSITAEDATALLSAWLSTGGDTKMAAEKLLMAQSAIVRRQAINTRRTVANFRQIVTAWKPDEIGEGLISLDDASMYLRSRSRLGVAQAQKGFEASYKGFLSKKLGDLAEYAAGRGMSDAERAARDLEIFTALRDQVTPDGPNPRNLSDSALRVADAIRQTFGLMRQRGHDLGEVLGELEDWGLTQAHDRQKLQNAAATIAGDKRAGTVVRSALARARKKIPRLGSRENFEAWAAFIVPHLDLDRMGIRVDPTKPVDQWTKKARRALESIYEGAAGLKQRPEEFGVVERQEVPGEIDDPRGVLQAFEEMQARRVIHFKDAASAFAYNSMFGPRDLFGGVTAIIEKAARSHGQRYVYGASPETARGRLIQMLKEHAGMEGRASVFSKVTAWKMRTVHDEVTGRLNDPVNAVASRVLANLRAYSGASKLASTAVTQLMDAIPASISNSFRFGGNAFGGSLQMLGRLVARFDGRERTVAIDNLLAGHDSQVGEILRDQRGDVGGATAWLYDATMKVGLVHYLDRTNIRTIAARVAHGFAEAAAKPSTMPQTERLLSAYGFEGPEDLRVLREASTMIGGRPFLSPENVPNVSREALDAYAAKRGLLPDQAADDLEIMLQTLISSEVSMARMVPTARTRGIMKLGTRSGTFAGEVVRAAGQFKSYPFEYARRLWVEWPDALGGKNLLDLPWAGKLRMAGFMSTMIAGGLMVQQLKALRDGKAPLPVGDDGTDEDRAFKFADIPLVNDQTLIRAITQAGVIPIYMDQILGPDAVEPSKAVAEAVMGPTVGGLFTTSMSALNTVKSFDPDAADFDKAVSTVNADLIRAAKGWTPFVGHWATKAAMDRLVWWQLQEMASPGWADKFEARSQMKGGTPYMGMRPSIEVMGQQVEPQLPEWFGRAFTATPTEAVQ